MQNENQGLALFLETFDIDVQCESYSCLRLMERRQSAYYFFAPRIMLYSDTLSGKDEKSGMRDHSSQ